MNETSEEWGVGVVIHKKSAGAVVLHTENLRPPSGNDCGPNHVCTFLVSYRGIRTQVQSDDMNGRFSNIRPLPVFIIAGDCSNLMTIIFRNISDANIMINFSKKNIFQAIILYNMVFIQPEIILIKTFSLILYS